MNKLIKISETHYVIVDDSEISYNPDGGTNGHFLCLHELQYGWKEAYVKNVGNCKGCRKITHSTTELEGVDNISLSYVEELLYGYNLNDLSKKHFPTPLKNSKKGVQYYKQKTQNPLKGFKKWDKAFKCGFNTHQELTKDKIVINSESFSSLQELVDDGYDPYDSAHHLQVQRILKVIENFIESVTPKTVWDITIDENNKITII